MTRKGIIVAHHHRFREMGRAAIRADRVLYNLKYVQRKDKVDIRL